MVQSMQNCDRGGGTVSPDQKLKAKRLLYTWKDLFANDLQPASLPLVRCPHLTGSHTCPTASCASSGCSCSHTLPRCTNCDGPMKHTPSPALTAQPRTPICRRRFNLAPLTPLWGRNPHWGVCRRPHCTSHPSGALLSSRCFEILYFSGMFSLVRVLILLCHVERGFGEMVI